MFFGRRYIIALLALVLTPVTLSAAGGFPDGQKHSLRIGWGEMLFETVAYGPTVTHSFQDPSGIPDSFRVKERFNYKYTGHIFAEYRYRIGDLVSVGAMIDFESISWQSGYFDKYHQMTDALSDTGFCNLVVMPTARITYFRKGLVSLHSGLGAGVLMSVAEKAEFAPALDVNLIGVQVGSGHWSGAIDLGLLNSMSNLRKVYLIASRLVSVSINYSW